MMRRKLKLTYLILAILFLIGSIATNLIISLKQKESVDLKYFTQVLHYKEDLIKQLLYELKTKISLHQFKEKNGLIFIDDFDFELLKENELAIVVYEFDTLRMWTDNKLVIPYVYDNSFDLQVNKFGNSWYEVVKEHIGGYTIIGMIKIKDEYPYHNQYLRDRFAKGFDIPPTVQISLIPVSFGYDVKSIDGNYIFTLVPSNFREGEEQPVRLPALLFLVAILLFLVYLYLELEDLGLEYVFIVFSGLVILRVVMYVFKVPGYVYNSLIFSPILGKYSLGDLVIDVSLGALFFGVLRKRVNYVDIRSEKHRILDYVVVGVINLLAVSLLFFLFDLFVSFIYKTSISFEVYRVIKLSIESLIFLIVFGFAIGFVLYLYFKVLSALRRYIGVKYWFVVLLLSYLLVGGVNLVFSPVWSYNKLLILFALMLILVGVKSLEKNLSYQFLVLSFITALVVSFLVLTAGEHKLSKQAKLLAEKIRNLRDPAAEQLLSEIVSKIDSDELLDGYLDRDVNLVLQDKIAAYLEKEYFTGYWKRYNLNVLLCADSQVLPSSQQLIICRNRLGEKLNKNAKRLADNLYFIERDDGTYGYLVKVDKGDKLLIIELTPKVMPRTVGYPELLLDENIYWQPPEQFSYARYYNHLLIVKHGEYQYPLDDELFAVDSGEAQFISESKYHHFVLPLSGEGSYVVVSYPKTTVYQVVITFAYLFVFYILTVLVGLFFANIGNISKLSYLSIKAKLMLSMVGILTVSFLSLGAVTVLFNVHKYKQKFVNETKQKLHSAASAIEIMLNNELDSINALDFEFSAQLQGLSEVIDADLNLYNSRGVLIATSREKIFQYSLLGKYMNYEALYNLLIKRKADYIANEEIGLLDYVSGYTILEDRRNRIVGFVNVPFFQNPQQLHEEISNLLVTLINLYVVLFILAVALAVLMSEQVVSPLKLLQQKLQKLKVGQKYEKIDYKRKDEIGKLVEEYNKMVDKLEESIELLAKSERESAWREMAKQIAHEIKNPLTPMKLNIQLLERAWENKDENFGERLKEISRTLIQQIETLRNIAEEFSTFAKMPEAHNEKLDLAQIVENITKLFENVENTEVKHIIKDRPVYIWADSRQISRALINLIKNAIQAIPTGVKGKVIVELERKDDKALLKVIDNGTGIPEEIRSKLFTPSFTTKSSGMGLGLPMVKSIVQNANGKIWFETELGKGTTFYLEFPIYQEKGDTNDSQVGHTVYFERSKIG